MTINKKELTLGHSYYYSPGNMHDGEIQLLPGHFIEFDRFPERFSGIPLTAEILTENLGFEKREHKGMDVGKYAHWDYWIKGDLVLRGSPSRLVYDKEDLDVKTVHQMQNLHWELKRKELEFKTKEG
jgi:hypothetical protein